MFIGITEIRKPIFEEELTRLALPEGYQTGSITYMIRQFHSKTLFSQSVYPKIESVYFVGDSGREIPRKVWTTEMAAHAELRESTVQREPKSVRYTIFGKALFTLLFALILVVGLLVARSMTEVKKQKAQEALLNIAPKAGDVYYGFYGEYLPSGVSKTGWTWLRIEKADGAFYLVSLNKKVSESFSQATDAPTEAFDERTYKVTLKRGTEPEFKTEDSRFNFSASRKQ